MASRTSKKQQLCTCSSLLHISLPFLPTTTWKCLLSRFTENVNKQRRNFILFLDLDMVPWNSNSGGFPYIWQSKCVRIIAVKTKRTQIDVLSDVLVAVASLDLKAPHRRRERDCLNYPLKSWERRGFPCSRSQTSGKGKAGFSRGHNYLKHQIHHVFAQVHLLLPSPQPKVGFTGNVFKISIDGRKIKKSAHTTSSPGLFPQRMGGVPHLFFEGKALGTRVIYSYWNGGVFTGGKGVQYCKPQVPLGKGYHFTIEGIRKG